MKRKRKKVKKKKKVKRKKFLLHGNGAACPLSTLAALVRTTFCDLDVSSG